MSKRGVYDYGFQLERVVNAIFAISVDVSLAALLQPEDLTKLARPKCLHIGEIYSFVWAFI